MSLKFLAPLALLLGTIGAAWSGALSGTPGDCCRPGADCCNPPQACCPRVADSADCCAGGEECCAAGQACCAR